MLEVGKAGSAGVGAGWIPVLRDGVPVATLGASGWKEMATAVIGDRGWVYAKSRPQLTARLATDPEDTVRLRAWPTSFWSSTWAVDLDGTPVEGRSISWWKTTHRYFSNGRQVAESGSTGSWSPRPTLTADDSLPLEHQVFLLWLEVVVTRRHNAAVAGGAGAAVIGGTS